MRPISQKFRKIINSDPFYRVCARKNSECSGPITIEHAHIYAGRQIDELWNFIPLCVFHHLGVGLDKKWNERYAVRRATPEELAKYPRKKWELYLK